MHEIRGDSELIGSINGTPARTAVRQEHRAVPEATSNTADLVAAAVRGTQQIHRPGYELIKAGVMLLDLQPASRHQHELALDEPAADTGRLMTALDRINDRYGRGTLAMASAGTVKTQRDWGMKQERRTPQYTIYWKEVPVVRA